MQEYAKIVNQQSTFNQNVNANKMMVEDSTNINKMNIHFSLQRTEHKNTTTYDVGNPG
jgi:hypothetical protein